ncbi:MAG TPA: 16S rRNA (uracil(1498)-N(3))-methyltransferase [Rhodanobacteraceae bacterium]
MREIRLYVDATLAGVTTLKLPAEAAQHALRVLRLGVGHPLVLFNGDGCDYVGRIERIEGKTACVSLLEQRTLANESPCPLTLVQCLARGDKMDLVVQKATELGVARITPVVSERSGVHLEAARADKRLQHWQAIAISACEQCGRARLPRIDAPRTLDAWLTSLDAGPALRLALLPEPGPRIRDLHMPDAGALLVVGPEGGFGERDKAALLSAGFTGMTLGPRILRTETAGLAALAAIHACHGDG